MHCSERRRRAPAPIAAPLRPRLLSPGWQAHRPCMFVTEGTSPRYGAFDLHRDYHPELLRCPAVARPSATRPPGTHAKLVGRPATPIRPSHVATCPRRSSDGRGNQSFRASSVAGRNPAPRHQRALATKIVASGILRAVAGRDAFHLAAAGVHRMDFLLTWNCKHIANPFIVERLHSCFSELGVHLPVICTPEQFFTDDDNDSQEQLPDDDA